MGSTGTCCSVRTADLGSPQSRSFRYLPPSPDSSTQAIWWGYFQFCRQCSHVHGTEEQRATLPSYAKWQ